MSSINAHYTFHYSQPSAYRFSHDSVFLARQVFELLQETPLGSSRVLDLCAGCGVVGLDFLFHCEKELGRLPEHFDFIEVQSEYAVHFAANAARFEPARIQYITANYDCLLTVEYARRYDLILCNPPYFHAGHGKLSPSEFKNRCRFFIDSDFSTLLRGIENSLRPAGRAFLLMRDLSAHGVRVFDEARAILSNKISLSQICEIRGTALIELRAERSENWRRHPRPESDHRLHSPQTRRS